MGNEDGKKMFGPSTSLLIATRSNPYASSFFLQLVNDFKYLKFLAKIFGIIILALLDLKIQDAS